MSSTNTGLRLYVTEADFPETAFPQEGDWNLAQFAEGRSIATREIFAAPPGGHSLSDCPRYEAMWRANVTAVVSALKGEERTCLVWVDGPIESDRLLLVMQYVDYWSDRGTGYHFEGFTGRRHKGPACCWSWLTFEFDPEVFATMMKNDGLDLESLPISMVFCDDARVDELLDRPFYKVGVQWVLEHNALALASPRHFEGCYLFGLQDTVNDAVRRVRALCIPTE